MWMYRAPGVQHSIMKTSMLGHRQKQTPNGSLQRLYMSKGAAPPPAGEKKL